MFRTRHRLARIGTLLAAGVFLASLFGSSTAVAAGPQHHAGRYLIVAKSDADFAALRAAAVAAGATVNDEISAADTLVVTGSGSSIDALAANGHVASAASDHIEKVSPPDSGTVPQAPHGARGGHPSSKGVQSDPAFGLDGLMWDFNRINAPGAWRTTQGSGTVYVGVADTGLDYTHPELAAQVAHVEDFTAAESPALCSTYFGASDADLSALYGGPADGDWSGHGTWIGGNIAAALDGTGINGIAPGVKLVALKIAQWCGYAYDSSILSAFQWAADNHINVVSISFGGYLDRSDPNQEVVYQQYLKTVAYAYRKGTVIVAAAGNEHARIGAGGKVLSHGILWTPGDVPDPVSNPIDFYGMYEVPGGIPGVVDVSSTGNVVGTPTSNCVGTYPNFTCKSTSDAHQSSGAGRQDQLAYYSNYGPRIDVAAPGGARKFNLPVWDGGGTPGFPVTTADGYAAYEDFSITSNWATDVPCYFNLGPQFYPDACYSTIQGTSMATPHVSAVVALIASARPVFAHSPAVLVAMLELTARRVWGNTTPALSATDTTPADATGVACPTGYCHLGGSPIPDTEAYGAGIIDARAAVAPFGR